MPDAYPDFLQWLPEANTVLRYDKNPEKVQETFNRADLVCCLDFNQYARVEANEKHSRRLQSKANTH